MNGFVRTLIYGLAGLCVMLLAGAVTLIFALKSNGLLGPKALRDLVLSKDEKAWIKAMYERQAEPAEQRPSRQSDGLSEEELIEHIADLANSNHATQLVSKLKRQQESMDERQAYLDQQWADLQLARTGIERSQRQLQDEETRMRDIVKADEDERARWALAQTAEVAHTTAMKDVEKIRYKDQAKLFETMKDSAWQSLRRFDAKEIARYLSFMDVKKAARMLIIAQQDSEYPGIALQIHREMLRIDLENATGDQVERLATLYSFMPADKVLAYLKESNVQEIADILMALARNGQVKKRAEILEALRKDDSKREMDVRHLIDGATKEGKQ